MTPMAAPRQIEKKIKPRMSNEAAASTGLFGISRVMMSASEFGVWRSSTRNGSIPVGIWRPSPGLIALASDKPIKIANKLVRVYQSNVFAPSRPSALPSPMLATPYTIEVKINGTITMRSRRIKVSASHATQPTSPKLKANTRPSAIAIKICQWRANFMRSPQDGTA